MKFFVCYVTGSTLAGNRNGGMAEFDTEQEARDEIESIVSDHTEYVVVLVHGDELERVSQ